MKKLIISGIFMLTTSMFLFAQSAYQVKSFKMTVAGTSTLHDWESKANKVTAKGDIMADVNAIQSIKNLSVEVDAKSIISTKGKVMDTKTWEALKADQHPKITFKLSKVESISKSGAEFVIKTTGNLSIAGVTKSVPMEAKGKILANGDLEFSGSKLIVLSDFGMEQPTALMGTVKVGKEVTVKFSVVMSSAAVQ
ncbi:MAG: YceI family protein [Saprospiraceae bacterium]|jgi:polyisoprenoid-binding protein YceI|nr:YceI family protein [Saprospiraceae bacterium]HRD79227.1 YceI family protein [Saprospiraceae bacterium]